MWNPIKKLALKNKLSSFLALIEKFTIFGLIKKVLYYGGLEIIVLYFLALTEKFSTFLALIEKFSTSALTEKFLQSWLYFAA